MKCISKKEYLENLEFYLSQLRQGKIFIFPTDTIYGIGTSAYDKKAIKKIREIKRRDSKPLSIIAPNRIWINKYFITNSQSQLFLDKLPGKFTFVLQVKENVLPHETISNSRNIGVRIPDNWFSKTLDIPIIATSVNFSGEPSATSLQTIPLEIQEKVDYMIDVGEINGKASTVIDLTKEEPVTLRK